MSRGLSLVEIEHMLNVCYKIKRTHPTILTHSVMRQLDDALSVWSTMDRTHVSEVVRAFEMVYPLYYNMMFLMVRDNK